jgi:hypothetical protein
MRVMGRLLVLVSLCSAVPAAAQAPRITPGGDPSVRSDSIYALHVDPADYPDQPYVVLLDDGVVRFEADGRGSRTYRQVLQILNQDGAETWGDQTFSYSAGHERLTVNWLKVLRLDGSVISDKAAHQQESQADAGLDSPSYSDERTRDVTLSGVAPGTLVDWSYTIEDLKPVLAGDYHASWVVRTTRAIRRSRLLVDLPATVAPRIQETNVHFPRRVEERNGRRVYTWATADVARFEPESYAASPNTLYVGIEVYAPMDWDRIASWYADLSRDRYELTPAVLERFGAAMAGAATAEDSLRALHRWVAQDFRYVSVSLGIGGYQPRPPRVVVNNGFGDCKDKATLFVALARRLGFDAVPVLVSSSAFADSTLPSITQFDHMIAAVARPGRGYQYFDLTSDLTPFGELPVSEQGGFGLVVRPDGRNEHVVLPEDSSTANRAEGTLTGSLSEDGLFTGHYEEYRTGSEQYGVRQAYSRTFTAEDVRKITQSIGSAFFPGGTGDSLQVFNGRDLRAPVRVGWLTRNARAVSHSGGTDILTLPLPVFEFSRIADELEAAKPRRFPIDVADIVGPVERVSTFRVTIPEGWQARLPPNVSVRSAFGDYSAEYSQSDREIRVTRRIAGWRGVQPPERVDELIEWMRAVAKDDAKFLVLDKQH